MGIFLKLSGLALRTVARDAPRRLGVEFLGGGVDAVSSYLTQHFTDHSQHLTAALAEANQRAWKALEIALAGDGFWDRCQRVLARTEDKAFREQVHAFLKNCRLPAIAGDAAAFRGKCLAELRDAARGGVLDGKLSAPELAREAGAFARFAEPQRLIEAEWQAVGQIALQLRNDGFASLAQFLELRPPDGPPLLVIAVRYFFRRAVEEDKKLQWIVSSAASENLAAAQQEGFAGLAQALDTHGNQVEALLEEMQRVVVETRDAVFKMRDDVQGLNVSVETLLRKLPSFVPADLAPAVPLNPKSAYLLELQPGGGFRPWELTRPYYSVGRDGAKISLADRRVSRRHLVLVQFGPHWLVLNLSSEKRLRVNGSEQRQKTLTPGDVLRIGDTWLVFWAGPSSAPPLRAMAGALRRSAAGSAYRRTLGSLEEEDDTCQCTLLQGKKVLAGSTGHPLLLGSHPLCGVPFPGSRAAACHCLLAWQTDGLQLIDLDSGLGTQVGGVPRRDALVQDGQEIVLGDQAVSVRLAGDPRIPAAARLRGRRQTPVALAMTCLYGPHAGETVVLPSDQPLVLSASADADLRLPEEPFLKSRHLELRVVGTSLVDPARRPEIVLRDLERRGDVMINRVRLNETATSSTGDVVQFAAPASATALLFHYDLALDAW